jgi:predicted RNA-binding protein with PUA domain
MNEDVTVGMTQEEAEAVGEKNDFPVRVTQRDGVRFVITADFNPFRRNIVLVQGVVTNVTKG